MSTTQAMPSARRRLVPGGVVGQPEPILTAADFGTDGAPEAVGGKAAGAPREPSDATQQRRAKAAGARPVRGPETLAPDRRPAADYASTRLVNFRIPVDLHDRFRALVREAEDCHPRLRKQSLTELLIALLEEGPRTADEVAELIRRKRLAEHGKG